MYIMHMVHEESEQKKKNAKKVVKKLGGRLPDRRQNYTKKRCEMSEARPDIESPSTLPKSLSVHHSPSDWWDGPLLSEIRSQHEGC